MSQTELQHVNRISRTIGAFNQIIQTIGMKPVKTLHCGLVNCRSAVNKTHEIKVQIQDNKLDVLALTETWIKEDDTSTGRLICPSEYNTISVSRKDKIGGGIAIIHHKDLDITNKKTYDFTSMECADFKIKGSTHTTNLSLIYRPPETSIIQFVEDLTTHMEQNITEPGHNIYLGDFNIKVNAQKDAGSITFENFMDSFDLTNRVTFPTHRLNNTLDLIVNKRNEMNISKVRQGPLLSDHNIIYFDLSSDQEVEEYCEIAYRKLDEINITTLRSYLDKHLIESDMPNKNCTDCIRDYNRILKNALDEVAPLKHKKVKKRKKLPWMNANIRKEICIRCKLEKIWKLDRDNTNKFLEFYRKRREVSNLIDKSEREYYKKNLQEHRRDYKKVFNICDNLLGREQQNALPDANSKLELANRFNKFFVDKVDKIRRGLEEEIANDNVNILDLHEQVTTGVEPLEQFQPVGYEYLCKVIVESNNKSCELDPLPTKLVKEYMEQIAPNIQLIINKSLTEGHVPAELKESLLRPLLKKSDLDKQLDKNFRPVSNLSWISKTLERVASHQLITHINNNNLSEKHQSAYKEIHSTETALLRIKNDII